MRLALSLILFALLMGFLAWLVTGKLCLASFVFAISGLSMVFGIIAAELADAK